MILLIDNYDRFSYNLYQLIGSVRDDIKVVRNDEIAVDDIENMNIDYIFLSPGPGKPENAGICIDVVKKYAGHIPIMGVCLGHQAICTAYGGVVSYAKQLMHGKTSIAKIDNKSAVFAGMDSRLQVARYHSLSAYEDTLPECLKVTAKTDDGEVMAVEHTVYPVYGLQFHPESVLTPDGYKIIENFLKIKM